MIINEKSRLTLERYLSDRKSEMKGHMPSES